MPQAAARARPGFCRHNASKRARRLETFMGRSLSLCGFCVPASAALCPSPALTQLSAAAAAGLWRRLLRHTVLPRTRGHSQTSSPRLPRGVRSSRLPVRARSRLVSTAACVRAVPQPARGPCSPRGSIRLHTTAADRRRGRCGQRWSTWKTELPGLTVTPPGSRGRHSKLTPGRRSKTVRSGWARGANRCPDSRGRDARPSAPGW